MRKKIMMDAVLAGILFMGCWMRCPELRLCAAAIQDSLPPTAPCELVVLQKVVGEWYEPEW